MKEQIMIVVATLAFQTIALAGDMKPGEPAPDGAALAIEVDSLNPSIPAGACAPQCLDVRYSDNKVSVFLVTSTGKRAFVGAYTPDWSQNPGERPWAGQWTRKIIVPKPLDDSLKSGPGCGADGWGYALGATIMSVTIPGGAIVTATYIGAGQQAITTVYSGGSGDSSIQPSPMTEAAASSNACEDMRQAMAPPIE
jgi:hypothetical protein